MTSLFPLRIRSLRPGRHVVEGGLVGFMARAEQRVTAEVKGVGKDQWVYFYEGRKKVWSCNPTFFRIWFRYVEKPGASKVAR